MDYIYELVVMRFKQHCDFIFQKVKNKYVYIQM